MKIVDVNNLLASAQGNVSEFKALKWLVYDKKIPAYELVKTDGRGKPDFIRITTGYGYEVKMLDKKGFIRFPERQYNTIRQLDGMVLVYEHDTDDHVPTPNNQPYETIPFDLLPEPAQCISANGINIYIDPSPDSYYTTIAIESSRKEILETLRGEIENKLHIDFRSWDEMLPQAVYSMLVGLDLCLKSDARRIGVKYFIADCPYCSTQIQLGIGINLYWYQKCPKCNRMFVAKRKI